MAKALWILLGLAAIGVVAYLACRTGEGAREVSEEFSGAATGAIDQAEQLRLETQERQRQLEKKSE